MSSTVSIASIEVPIQSFEKDFWLPESSLVLTKSTIANLKKILVPLLEGDNLLLIGDAGVGKNALIYYINHLRSQATIRYSFNEDSLSEDLIGAYRIDPQSKDFIWNDGPLSKALQEGATFVADEMNLCQTDTLKRFYSIFSEKQLELLEGDTSLIKAKAGFNFVATQNPVENFEGRKDIPIEIRKYFTTIYIDPYPIEEQVEILQGLYPKLNQKEILAIVHTKEFVEKSIRTFQVGLKNLEHFHFNLRNLKRLSSRLLISKDFWEAELADIFIRPFRDPQEQIYLAKEITKIIKKIMSKEIFLEDYVLENILYQEPIEEDSIFSIDKKEEKLQIGRATIAIEKKENFRETLKYCLPVPQNLRSIEAIAQAIQNNEHILLECSPDVDAEDYVYFFSTLYGRNLRIINLSRGVHTSDILGAIKPEKNKNILSWIDGPLTAGIRSGDFILLRGLESAVPELIEKLNMLLDDARGLTLPPEAEDKGQALLLSPKTRIFGIKFFREERMRATISRAFRNRFSAIVLPSISDKKSLIKICAHALDVESQSYYELLHALVSFHLLVSKEAKEDLDLGSYEFGLSNLKRWCHYILVDLGKGKIEKKKEVIQDAASVAYINEVASPQTRLLLYEKLNQILEGVPILPLLKNIEAQKKKIQKNNWDPEKYKRKATTGKFKPRIKGRKRKKGLRINTPETGGNTKEGPDAWYGSDTVGNKGQGEPGGGGGAWGYRTLELYQEFIRRPRKTRQYSLSISLEEYKENFGLAMQNILSNFDPFLKPQAKLKRIYKDQGSRIDLRRYLAYMSGKGDDKIFDKSFFSLEENNFKDIEIIFALNKGRRIFAFDYSFACLLAIMSLSKWFAYHKLPFGLVCYSDLSNLKEDIDLLWAKKSMEYWNVRKEYEIFDALANGWHGDTVAEAPVLSSIFEEATRDKREKEKVRTRIIVAFSDFRGFRGKLKVKKELESYEWHSLYDTYQELKEKDTYVLGIGLGPRQLAENMFEDSIGIGNENFDELPNLLASKICEVLHKYHFSFAKNMQ